MPQEKQANLLMRGLMVDAFNQRIQARRRHMDDLINQAVEDIPSGMSRIPDPVFVPPNDPSLQPTTRVIDDPLHLDDDDELVQEIDPQRKKKKRRAAPPLDPSDPQKISAAVLDIVKERYKQAIAGGSHSPTGVASPAAGTVTNMAEADRKASDMRPNRVATASSSSLKPPPEDWGQVERDLADIPGQLVQPRPSVPNIDPRLAKAANNAPLQIPQLPVMPDITRHANPTPPQVGPQFGQQALTSLPGGALGTLGGGTMNGLPGALPKPPNDNASVEGAGTTVQGDQLKMARGLLGATAIYGSGALNAVPRKARYKKRKYKRLSPRRSYYKPKNVSIESLMNKNSDFSSMGDPTNVAGAPKDVVKTDMPSQETPQGGLAGAAPNKPDLEAQSPIHVRPQMPKSGLNALTGLPVQTNTAGLDQLKIAAVEKISPFCAGFIKRAAEVGASPEQLQEAITNSMKVDPIIAKEWQSLLSNEEFQKEAAIEKESSWWRVLGKWLLRPAARAGGWMMRNPTVPIVGLGGAGLYQNHIQGQQGLDIQRQSANQQALAAQTAHNIRLANEGQSNIQLPPQLWQQSPVYRAILQAYGNDPQAANNARMAFFALNREAMYDPPAQELFNNPSQITSGSLNEFMNTWRDNPGNVSRFGQYISKWSHPTGRLMTMQELLQQNQGGASPGPQQPGPQQPGPNGYQPVPYPGVGGNKDAGGAGTTNDPTIWQRIGNNSLMHNALLAGGGGLGLYGLSQALAPDGDEKGKQKSRMPGLLMGGLGLGLGAYGLSGGNMGNLFNRDFWKFSSVQEKLAALEKRADPPAANPLNIGLPPGTAPSNLFGGSINLAPFATALQQQGQGPPQAGGAQQGGAQPGAGGGDGQQQTTTSGQPITPQGVASAVGMNAGMAANDAGPGPASGQGLPGMLWNMLPSGTQQTIQSGLQQGQQALQGMGGMQNLPRVAQGARHLQNIQAPQQGFMPAVGRWWSAASWPQRIAALGGMGLLGAGAYGLINNAMRGRGRDDEDSGGMMDYLLPLLMAGGGGLALNYGLTGSPLSSNIFSPSRWTGQPGARIGQPLTQTGSDGQQTPINHPILQNTPLGSPIPQQIANNPQAARAYHQSTADALAQHIPLSDLVQNANTTQGQQSLVQALSVLGNLPQDAQVRYFVRQMQSNPQNLGVVGALGSGAAGNQVSQQLAQMAQQLGIPPQNVQGLLQSAQQAWQIGRQADFKPGLMNGFLMSPEERTQAVVGFGNAMLGGAQQAGPAAPGQPFTNAALTLNPNQGSPTQPAPGDPMSQMPAPSLEIPENMTDPAALEVWLNNQTPNLLLNPNLDVQTVNTMIDRIIAAGGENGANWANNPALERFLNPVNRFLFNLGRGQGLDERDANDMLALAGRNPRMGAHIAQLLSLPDDSTVRSNYTLPYLRRNVALMTAAVAAHPQLRNNFFFDPTPEFGRRNPGRFNPNLYNQAYNMSQLGFRQTLHNNRNLFGPTVSGVSSNSLDDINTILDNILNNGNPLAIRQQATAAWRRQQVKAALEPIMMADRIRRLYAAATGNTALLQAPARGPVPQGQPLNARDVYAYNLADHVPGMHTLHARRILEEELSGAGGNTAPIALGLPDLPELTTDVLGSDANSLYANSSRFSPLHYARIHGLMQGRQEGGQDWYQNAVTNLSRGYNAQGRAYTTSDLIRDLTHGGTSGDDAQLMFSQGGLPLSAAAADPIRQYLTTEQGIADTPLARYTPTNYMLGLVPGVSGNTWRYGQLPHHSLFTTNTANPVTGSLDVMRSFPNNPNDPQAGGANRQPNAFLERLANTSGGLDQRNDAGPAAFMLPLTSDNPLAEASHGRGHSIQAMRNAWQHAQTLRNFYGGDIGGRPYRGSRFLPITPSAPLQHADWRNSLADWHNGSLTISPNAAKGLAASLVAGGPLDSDALGTWRNRNFRNVHSGSEYQVRRAYWLGGGRSTFAAQVARLPQWMQEHVQREMDQYMGAPISSSYTGRTGYIGKNTIVRPNGISIPYHAGR